MQLGVPIFEGRIDRTLFEQTLKHEQQSTVTPATAKV
jgi:hypothetical protein